MCLCESGYVEEAGRCSPCSQAHWEAGVCADGPSCNAIKLADPTSPDGIYYIAPARMNGPPQAVYCDMTTDNGGWTLVYKIAGQSTMMTTDGFDPELLAECRQDLVLGVFGCYGRTRGVIVRGFALGQPLDAAVGGGGRGRLFPGKALASGRRGGLPTQQQGTPITRQNHTGTDRVRDCYWVDVGGDRRGCIGGKRLSVRKRRGGVE